MRIAQMLRLWRRNKAATRGRDCRSKRLRCFEILERRLPLSFDLSFNPDGAFGPQPGIVSTDLGSLFDLSADVAIQPGIAGEEHSVARRTFSQLTVHRAVVTDSPGGRAPQMRMNSLVGSRRGAYHSDAARARAIIKE